MIKENQIGNAKKTARGPAARKNVRLKPLLDVMRERSISIESLANAMGLPRFTVNRWFKLDDTRLSRVEAAAAALGYEARLSVFRQGEETTDWDSDGIGQVPIRKHSCKRLMPLLEAIFGQGLNVSRASEAATICRQTMNAMFVKDDAALLTIWRIAEAVGCEARITLTKIEN